MIRPLPVRVARAVCGYLDGEAHPSRFVDSQYDIRAMRACDIARDREPEPAAALLGGKQRLKDAWHNFRRYRSGWIDHVDSDRSISVGLSVEFYLVAAMACVDRIQHQVQQRLMHLVRVEFSFETAVYRDVDRYAFVGRMCASDGGDVVKSVGDVNRGDLHRARPCVDQEVGGQPLQTLGFFRGDREHLFPFRFVQSRPRGGGQRAGDHRNRISNLVRDCPGQLPDCCQLLVGEQLLTRALEFLQVAHKARLSLAKIVHQQPDQHSHHAVNYGDRTRFDVFAELHPISAHERNKNGNHDHNYSAGKVQSESRFEYRKQHQGVIGGVSLNGQWG